jgi:hypothetical protein
VSAEIMISVGCCLQCHLFSWGNVLMLHIYESTWIEKQTNCEVKKKNVGIVMLSRALMILYCIKKVKVLRITVPGIF